MNDNLAMLKAIIEDNVTEPTARSAALENLAKISALVTKKEVFLFYDRETGLYGGSGLAETRMPIWELNKLPERTITPQWDKRGKVWTTIGALKNHLHLVSAYADQILPSNWRVLRCQLSVLEDLSADAVLKQGKDKGKGQDNG